MGEKIHQPNYQKFLSLGTIILLLSAIPSISEIELSAFGGKENHSENLYTDEAGNSEDPQLKEPPLEDSLEEPKKEDSRDRIDSLIPEKPWWERTERDLDGNGIVDSLESKDYPFPVVVSYSRDINDEHINALGELGIQDGYVINAINAVSIGMREPSMYSLLASLSDVVMVEPAGNINFLSDIATKAVKARASQEYSPETAWEFTNASGGGINIAVVDTGIDDGHPSLEGKRVAGYDAVTPEARTDGKDNPDDRNGHGTTCSGIAAGTSEGDPELSYKGTAPNASLIDVQIGTDIGAGPFENYLLPTTYYDSALRGIEWVRDNADTEWEWVEPELYGIDVMSLSWGITSHENGGSDGSDPFSRLIDEVVGEGVVCVGAAGNDGPNNDGFSGMSASSKAIIVGATDDINTVGRDDDVIASYSSRGPRRDNNDGYPYDELKPDVSAPGTNIWNTDPCVTSEGCYGDAEGHGYEARGSGTSYATPAVAGVVSLILEANPTLTPEHVKGILHQTSERRGEPTFPELDPFWNKDFGYGMVDAYEAVKLAEELNEVDTGLIDVELQAYVMNVTEEKAGNPRLKGLAWAKVGTVDKVEISIDGGAWKEADYENTANGTVETGEYINWTFQVKRSKLSRNNMHVARVRAVGEGHFSIWDSFEFFGKELEDDDEGFIPGFQGTVLISVMLVEMIALLGFRKRYPNF